MMETLGIATPAEESRAILDATAVARRRETESGCHSNDQRREERIWVPQQQPEMGRASLDATAKARGERNPRVETAYDQ